jgi:hypothetical protein
MALAEAVQTKGFGSRLYQARNSSMAAINSGTLRNTPLRSRFCVNSRNQHSTRFSHEEQIPAEKWHGAIGDPTLADAILDRLVHNAYRITLK